MLVSVVNYSPPKEAGDFLLKTVKNESLNTVVNEALEALVTQWEQKSEPIEKFVASAVSMLSWSNSWHCNSTSAESTSEP